MQEDLDAMMIAQMLEEDESRILAEKIQNEMYGSGPALNRVQENFMGGYNLDASGK